MLHDFIKKNYKSLIAILLLTIFSVLINGYFHGTADSAMRGVMIKTKLDSSIYKNDLMASQAPFFYTYLHLIMLPFMKLIGLEATLIIFRFLGLFFSYIAIFCLSKFLFNDGKTALLSVILLLVIKPSMGGETFRSLFVESDVALPLLLFAFMFMLKKRYFISALLAGVAVNIHITSAIPTFGILFLYMLFTYKKTGFRSICCSLLIFLASASPMLITILVKKSSLSLIASSFLLSIMKLSLVHHFFILEWFTSKIYIERWIRFFVFFAAYLVAFKYKPRKEHHDAIIKFFYALLILLSASVFFTYVIPQPLIMNLQMFRVTSWIPFFGALYLANYLAREYQKSSLFSRLIFVGLGSSYFITNFKGVLIFLIFLFAQKFRKIRLIYLLSCAAGLTALILSGIATFYINLPFISPLKLGTLPLCIIFFSIAACFAIEKLRHKLEPSALNSAIAFAILIVLVFASLGMASLRANLQDSFYGGSIFELSFTGAVTPNPISLQSFSQILAEPKKYIVKNVQFGYELPRNSWEDSQLWVKSNTGKNDIVITPPHLTGFRYYSERAAVAEWLDIILSTVNEEYGRQIWERLKDVCNSPILGYCEGEYGYTCSRFCGDQYSKLDEAYFKYLAKKYNANYVLVERPKSLNFRLAYENEGFRIYKINYS